MKRAMRSVEASSVAPSAYEAEQPMKRRRGAKANTNEASRVALVSVDYNATEKVGAKGGKHQHPRKTAPTEPAQEDSVPREAAEAVEAAPKPQKTPAGQLRGFPRFRKYRFPVDEEKSRARGDLHKTGYTEALIQNLFLRENEMTDLNADYFNNFQDDIKPRMRVILYNWLVDVDLKFNLREEVLWRTFQIVDRYLSVRKVNRRKLQLVACAATWIASKYFEIYPPTPNDLVHISDHAFVKSDVLKMEVEICRALDMEFSYPTSYEFLQRFLEIALTALSPIRAPTGKAMVRMDSEPQVKKMKQRVKNLAFYIMERYAHSHMALTYKASLVAAAALYTSLALTSFRWTSTVVAATGYTSEDIRVKYGLYRSMKAMIMTYDDSKHEASIRKYASEKRGRVSNLRRKRD